MRYAILIGNLCVSGVSYDRERIILSTNLNEVLWFTYAGSKKIKLELEIYHSIVCTVVVESDFKIHRAKKQPLEKCV